MKAKDMALGGILVALAIITLSLTYLIPTNTLAVLSLSSIFVPIAIIRSNSKTAITVFVASSIIAFMVIPINYSIMYACLFGSYGLAKYYIERFNKLIIEIPIKLAYFNIVFSIGLLLISLLGTELSNLPSLLVIYLIGNVVFVVYDYALSTLINLYYTKIHKKGSKY